MEREEGRKTREEKRKEEKGTERGILRSSNQRERSEEN